MKMSRIAAVVLITGVAACAGMAQTITPSEYEGTSNPPNSIDDQRISTAATAPSLQSTVSADGTTTTTVETMPATPANTPAVAQYLVPDGSPQPVVGPTVNQPARPQLKQPVVPVDPDDGIVTFVPLKPGELAPGTVIKMRLDQELSTERTLAGSAFSGHVTQNVMQDGVVAIPVNAVVRGRVTGVAAGRRFRGPASIRLRPDEVILPDNSRMSLHADVVDVDSHGTKTDSEGNVVSTDHGKRTLGELALVGGAGAVVGAEIGGPPGALIGGAVGAGIITTHWLLDKHEATLPPDSEIAIGLSEPMTLSPLHQ